MATCIVKHSSQVGRWDELSKIFLQDLLLTAYTLARLQLASNEVLGKVLGKKASGQCTLLIHNHPVPLLQVCDHDAHSSIVPGIQFPAEDCRRCWDCNV